MKKTVSAVMLFALLRSVLSMGACGKTKQKSAKIGIGIYKELSTEDASGTKNGSINAVSTVAVTLFDKDGKIIECYLDTLDAAYGITADGKYVKSENEDVKSKRELGDSYVMSEDKSKLKWYEQANAFATLAKGKTVDEVKGLVASGGKGTEAVLSAGCTIAVSEFAMAIVESAKKTEDVMINAKPKTDLKIKHEVTATDATESAMGKITVTVKAEGFINDKGDKTPTYTAKSEYKASFDKSGRISVE